MKLDDGMKALPTSMGLCLTVVLFVCVMAYSVLKIDTLVHVKDVDILSAVNDRFYDPDYIFRAEDGLNFAVGLTAWDSTKESILDPSIGRIRFIAYEWGSDELGNPYSSYDEIPSHACSREELGLVGENPAFMPIIE